MPNATVNGTQLHYRDEGPRDAPAVVFSHSLFFDSEMFHKQVAALSGQRRVVCYDHRGQGQSAPAPREQLDMDTLTDDAAALIEHLGLGPCHVAGNSMGGFIALRLASRRPDLLRSATIISSSAEEEYKLADFEPLVDAVGANGTTPAIDALMHIMFGDTFLADDERADERAKYRDAMLALPDRIADAAQGVIHRDGVLDELSGVRVPVLVVAGEEDHAYEVPRSEAIVATIDGARLEVVPGAGHSASLEEPDAVNAAMLDLFAATERAAV